MGQRANIVMRLCEELKRLSLSEGELAKGPATVVPPPEEHRPPNAPGKTYLPMAPLARMRRCVTISSQLGFSVLVRRPDHRLSPADRRKQLQRPIWRLFARSVPRLPARTEVRASPNLNIVSVA
jgi:hypothetical protein